MGWFLLTIMAPAPPRKMQVACAMIVSLAPIPSPREREMWTALRATFIVIALLLAGCTGPEPEPRAQAIWLDQAMGGDGDTGFARALHPRAFQFPTDHGAHPEFKHEWWYFTGNLAGVDGHRFGYQVTFFRMGMAAGGPARESAWATRQIWMAHVALSDIEAAEHQARERFSREAIGLAGAEMDPLRVWVEDWRIVRAAGSGIWSIRIAAEGFGLELELEKQRPPVLQGDAGLYQKGSKPGNASYYYSIPRLTTRGRVMVADNSYRVQGLSWLDREWSTSDLGTSQVGWDWFSLQLADGSDLMYYQLRRKDGTADPHSRGSLVLADGRRLDLSPDAVELRPLRWWQRPGGPRYPIVWSLSALPLGHTLTVRALLPDQLMDLTVRYWEGAVEVRDGDESVGYGYLEMTGY
jgi:predicted secreted hydrolase